MWAVLPKRCRTKSNNMSPNLSVLALFPKKAYFLLVGENLPPRLILSLLLLIQPLDSIFYKILPVLNIMMTADFLFLPKAAHLFIYLLSGPHRENFPGGTKVDTGPPNLIGPPQALSGPMPLNHFLSGGCRFSFKSEGITIYCRYS